jgi:hypothetical protein
MDKKDIQNLMRAKEESAKLTEKFFNDNKQEPMNLSKQEVFDINDKLINIRNILELTIRNNS